MSTQIEIPPNDKRPEHLGAFNGNIPPVAWDVERTLTWDLEREAALLLEVAADAQRLRVLLDMVADNARQANRPCQARVERMAAAASQVSDGAEVLVAKLSVVLHHHHQNA